MIRIWRIHRAFRRFFETYYSHILTLSVMVATSVGFLHYELKHNSEELIYWKNLLRDVFNETEGLILLPLLLLVTSLMLVFVFVIAINLDSMRSYDELTKMEIKKRYTDFLFIQLITRIELIERKQLQSREAISIENFIRAHEDLRKVIDKFRMDTKTILSLSEVEELPPPEVIFSDEEIRNSRFAHLSPEENLVRELAAS